MASSRVKRGLKRSAADRRAQLAAGGVVAAGAAVAGKAALAHQDGEPEGDGPSRAYRLKRKEGPAEGIVRIAIGRVDKALEELSQAGNDGDVGACVHAARKDLKKVRGALRLVREEVGEERFLKENGRYRGVGRRLSARRDAEVKLETLAGLGERFGEEMPEEAVKNWSTVLREERDAVNASSEVAVQIEFAIGELEVGRDEVARWRLSTDSWDLLAPGIERSYRRGRREMKRAAAKRRAEDVHRWRKRVKDLWYQLRILRGAWPSMIGETATQAHELADLLGDHHDLTVLLEDLEAREELADEKRLAKLIRRRQAELLDTALDLGTRLFAEKPKAFLRRLDSYWQAWRPR